MSRVAQGIHGVGYISRAMDFDLDAYMNTCIQYEETPKDDLDADIRESCHRIMKQRNQQALYEQKVNEAFDLHGPVFKELMKDNDFIEARECLKRLHADLMKACFTPAHREEVRETIQDMVDKLNTMESRCRYVVF